MTFEEFLAWQSAPEFKHEYDQGRVIPHVVAMPGGRTSHNRIERNLVRSLDVAFTSNQFVATIDGEVAYFPDAALIDGPPKTIRYGTQHAATNPAAEFEITSPSTREYDGGRKLEVYRSITTMREVFLIESGEARVVRHFRTASGGRRRRSSVWTPQ